MDKVEARGLGPSRLISQVAADPGTLSDIVFPAHDLGLLMRRRGVVMAVGGISLLCLTTSLDQDVPLQSIFSREALVAMSAGERLHGQVYPLVPLQVVVAIEALRALVAFEGSLVLALRRRWSWATRV